MSPIWELTVIVQQVAKENENGDYQSFIGVIFHPGELLDRLRHARFARYQLAVYPENVRFGRNVHM